jgi:lysophospholipid acyltransferase (LPLAT)-like uncharacterized protein
VEASRAWTLNSWDRHQVPKPGSLLSVAIGEPIEVAAFADANAIERARIALEQALGALEADTAASLARESH